MHFQIKIFKILGQTTYFQEKLVCQKCVDYRSIYSCLIINYFGVLMDNYLPRMLKSKFGLLKSQAHYSANPNSNIRHSPKTQTLKYDLWAAMHWQRVIDHWLRLSDQSVP